MNRKKLFWVLAGFLFLVVVVSCSLPSTPTPFAIPTPNLTMTALFKPTETIPPSITPPLVQTATPVPGSPTPEGGASPTPVTPTPTPAQGTAVGATARSGPSVEAVFLETTPVVDGDLTEWNLTSYGVNSVVFGAANHTGSGDLSGEVMVGWDDKRLFIGAQVMDDTYAQNARGELIYKGDSLELLLDTRLEADFFVASLSPDDFQLGISPGATVGKGVEVYLWFPEEHAGPRNDVVVAKATQTEDGYQVELAIPWALFEIDPAEGDRFGFAFSISDNDDPLNNLQQSMVSNVPTRLLVDPTSWGNLVLLGP